MSKLPLLLCVAVLLTSNARGQGEKLQAGGKVSGVENNQSAEQLREFEIDELIRSLEQRIGAKERDGGEAYEVVNENDYQRAERQPGCAKTDVFQEQPKAHHVHPNSRDRKFLMEEGAAKARADAEREARARLDKRKIADHLQGDVDELKKEALGFRNERTLLPDASINDNKLSDFEKDEQYYRALLRLQNLYQMYNKRYLNEDFINDDRPSRNCGSDLLSRKVGLIETGRLRYLERSRILADRIAESAMHLVRKKERLLDHLLRPGCGCARRPVVVQEVVSEPVVVAAVEPPIVVEEAKRDVELSSASSSATSIDASVGVGGVSAGVSTSSASASNVGVGLGGVGASVSSSSAVSSDVQVGAGLGLGGIAAGVNSRLGVGLGVGRGLGVGYLDSYDDYDRRLIMDMAIEEAANMIRKLAYETRSEISCKEDPEFERRVLGLAIDLVNKATIGVTGEADLLSGFRYNNVDDYLKSTIYEAETEADLLSNAGFDYVNHGLGRLDEGFEDYVGHASPYSRGRCESCSKLGGNTYPLYKRSGNIFQGRVKRKPIFHGIDTGKVHHLEQMSEVQNKAKIK